MTTPISHRKKFMKLALQEAQQAMEQGEIPIGAVVVCNGKVIASAHNKKEQTYDPTAHAEIIVLREAGKKLTSWHLDDCEIYVTLEPCPMCAYAIVQARIKTLVFGAFDPKAGGVRSIYALCEDPRLNHRVNVITNVMKEESQQLLQTFFKSLRAEKKTHNLEDINNDKIQ